MYVVSSCLGSLEALVDCYFCGTFLAPCSTPPQLWSLTEMKRQAKAIFEPQLLALSSLDVKFSYWCLLSNSNLLAKRTRCGHLSRKVLVYKQLSWTLIQCLSREEFTFFVQHLLIAGRKVFSGGGSIPRFSRTLWLNRQIWGGPYSELIAWFDEPRIGCVKF